MSGKEEAGFRVEWDDVSPAEFLLVCGGDAALRAEVYAEVLRRVGYIGVRVVPAVKDGAL